MNQERIRYTLTGCTRSGPFYLQLKNGNAESRRTVFDSLRAIKADGGLIDLQIWRSPYYWNKG